MEHQAGRRLGRIHVCSTSPEEYAIRRVAGASQIVLQATAPVLPAAKARWTEARTKGSGAMRNYDTHVHGNIFATDVHTR